MLEHAVGLLLSLGTFCSSNVALMARCRGKEVLSNLRCDEARVDIEQRERIDEITHRLLHYLMCQ